LTKILCIACSTTVNVAISFGGQSWTISSDDFRLAQISNSQCLGAIFVYTASGGNNGTPTWIVGDTFLKNVYSVFRANPASVGFAAIASGAQSSVTRNGVPTATIGSASVSVTGNRSGNAAFPSATPHLVTLLFVMTTSLFYFL
jgi:cathepsin D